MFKHSLNDSTSIRVCGQRVHLASKGVEDEGNVFGGYSFDGFLDHMIAVLILDAFQNIGFKLFD